MQVSASMIQKALIEDLLDPTANAKDRAYARAFLLGYGVDHRPTIGQLGLLSDLERDTCDPDFRVVPGIRRSSLFVFSRFFRKIDIGSTRDSKESVLASFIARQDRVLGYDSIPDRYLSTVRRVCDLLLGKIPDDIWEHPRFGPGVVAEGNLGLDKADIPLPPHLVSLDPLCRLRQEPACNVSRTRILVVPKDWRGGRVIGAEPVWNMAAQLSAKGHLEDALGCVVPFHNQDKQRAMLRNRALATIDLSNASDHVSVALCREILPPEWFDHLMSIRTNSYVTHDHIGRTESFALMGNGFCFPILSCVCFAIAFASIWLEHGRYSDLTRYEIVRFAKRHGIQTFGDDIVVPSASYTAVVTALSLFGLCVNQDKSFSTPFFRETCGYYHFGEEEHGFTVPYLKTLDWNDSGATTLDASIAQLEKLGFWKASHALSSSCPYQARETRWRRRYQRLEVQTRVIASKTREVSLANHSGYFHAFHGGIPRLENVGSGQLTLAWSAQRT